MVIIPVLKKPFCVQKDDKNEYLILLKAKEEIFMEKLCGKRYSHEKKDYKRYKTSSKKVYTRYGAFIHNFSYVKHKKTGKIASPLLDYLGIEKNQHLSYEFKCILVRKAARTTYGDAVEDIEDSFEFPICRQTLHTYTQNICSNINIEQEVNNQHRVLLADGTKAKSQIKGKKHEVKSIISIGDSFDDKVLLKQAVNKTWSEMANELDLDQYLAFVGDGELGLASNLKGKNTKFQFCHQHAQRDLPFYLWKDGLAKKEYNSYCIEFKSILYHLQNSTKKHKKSKNWLALAFRIRDVKRRIHILADELISKNLEQGGFFLKRNIDYFTTAAEMAILGIEVPWTTNGIERLMKEIGKRTKKKSMHWSEKGLENVLKMTLKRYFLPKKQRTYKDIFAINKIEGIES